MKIRNKNLTAQEICADRARVRRAERAPDTIINMTPHPINVIRNGEVVQIFENKGIVRIATTICRDYDPVAGIPTCRTFYKDTAEGLPEYQKGTWYIVSQIVRSALPNRRDLLVPTDLVRDETGNIIGCESLGR